jgi:hypothetical protein
MSAGVPRTARAGPIPLTPLPHQLPQLKAVTVGCKLPYKLRALARVPGEEPPCST